VNVGIHILGANVKTNSHLYAKIVKIYNTLKFKLLWKYKENIVYFKNIKQRTFFNRHWWRVFSLYLWILYLIYDGTNMCVVTNIIFDIWRYQYVCTYWYRHISNIILVTTHILVPSYIKYNIGYNTHIGTVIYQI
jgi:hypothetical protein